MNATTVNSTFQYFENHDVVMNDLRSLEIKIWGSSFVLVTMLGLFARYLDDLEHQRLKELKLRNTNLFCATFMLCCAFWYFLLSVLQGGKGTWTGFYDLLVGVRQLNELEEFQAGILNSLMLGYMFQDLVGRLIFKNFKISFILHHVACIVGLLLALFWGHSGMYGCVVGLSEFSTPLVSIIEIGRADGMKKLVLYCGILLNLVFPFRVMMFTSLTYLWAFEHVEAPFWYQHHHNFTINAVGIAAIATLTVLQWFWWSVLLKTTVQTLFPQPKPKAA